MRFMGVAMVWLGGVSVGEDWEKGDAEVGLTLLVRGWVWRLLEGR